MQVTVDHDAVSSGWLPHDARYILIEPTGERVGFHHWIQRPAALRAATGRGVGVYDLREREVIHQPDAEDRIEVLKGTLDSLRRQQHEAEALLARVEKAVADAANA